MNYVNLFFYQLQLFFFSFQSIILIVTLISGTFAQIRPIPPYGATGEANAVILKHNYDLNPDGSYIYK